MKQLLILIVLISTQFVAAETLFEGYYKVTQMKKHLGFSILRHEIDSKSKTFKTTVLTRLGKNGVEFTESYQAVSSTDLAPQSLNYLSVDSKSQKIIDAKFKNQKITGLVTENGKKIKLNEKYPKGVFFSSALYYLMMNSKEGLKTDSKLDFQAITEEGPVVMPGTVSVDKKMTTMGSMQLFKVTNKFAGADYDNLLSTKGEVVSLNTPATGVESELVKNKEEATEGVKISSGTIEKIFGNIPEGKTNVFFSKGK